MTPGHEIDATLRQLVLESADMAPDVLPQRVRTLAEDAGASDVELLIADLSQRSLHPLLDGNGPSSYPVAGSPPGDAYRTTSVVRIPSDEGTRLWLPVMNSAERVGVLGITVDEPETVEHWRGLTSLVGELLVAKARYGDGLSRSRRTRPITLAAEMRWSLLPPLTYRSPAASVSGILEPAYEIAGDTFDYAVNGDTVHMALLDAMGHGLEASRMANVAVASYRHGRKSGLSLEDTALAIDGAVQACFDRSRYVTGQLARFDVGSGWFRMLNMGHPLPLLLRRGAVHGELPSKPMLPAGWGDKRAEISEARLEPGDQVLMYTDGITEASTSTGDLYGQERLVAFLAETLPSALPPEEVLREVIEDVMVFQDYRASDDATLLLLTIPDRPDA